MEFKTAFNIGQTVYRIDRESKAAFKKCVSCVSGNVTLADGSKFACPICSGKGILSNGYRYVWRVFAPMTVGQVRIEYSNTDGAQKEQYMCNETGVGSGSLWPRRDLFATKQDANTEATLRNNDTRNFKCVRCLEEQTNETVAYWNTDYTELYCIQHEEFNYNRHVPVDDNGNLILSAKLEAEEKESE